MKISVTVSICTFNRVSILPAALETVLEQSFDPEQFEILIVDNASTDKTEELIERYQKKYSKIRYVKEMTPGIASARNRAMLEAKGSYLAFLDDDAKADRNWLEELIKPVTQGNLTPVPACVAGPVFLDWEGGKPDWFPAKYEPLLCRYEEGENAKFLGSDGYLLTTNALFNVEVLKKIGGFRTYLGRNRKQLLGGEDNDMYQRLFAEGHGIFYQPSAKVWHGVPKDRQTRAYLLQRLYWDGVSQPLLAYSRKKIKEDYPAWKESYYDCVRFFHAFFGLIKGAVLSNRALMWEAVYALYQELGKLRSNLQMAMGTKR